MSAVGKETLAYCTSCKMDLNHTIVAMAGDRVIKVQCRTCRKEHQYKAPKGVSDPAKAPAPRAPREPRAEAKPIELEWEKLMSQHKAAPRKPYNVKTKFLPGDVVAHPTFGEGIVDKLIHPNKVEILFRMDLKVLIHGGQ